MIDLRLADQTILSITKDKQHPCLWRILNPADHISDLANIDRAKDAAILIAMRITGISSPQRFKWARTCL